MFTFFGRQWRGEVPFWITTLVFSLMLPWALTIFGIKLLSAYTIDSTPYRCMIAAIVVIGLIAAVGIWQLVGTWRASSKAKATNRWWITRWMARTIAIAGFALAAFAVSTLPAGMKRYYAEATDTDEIGLQGYDVTVDGDRVVVTGQMTWGLYDGFLQALRDNDHLQVIVLNSPGGHYAVGRRIGELIKKRRLDTLTTEMCGSACTYAYLGGNRRILQEGARLGFHDASGNTPSVLVAVRDHAGGVLRAANVPEEFISRVFETPAESAWYPTAEELVQANIVTDVVEPSSQ